MGGRRPGRGELAPSCSGRSGSSGVLVQVRGGYGKAVVMKLQALVERRASVLMQGCG